MLRILIVYGTRNGQSAKIATFMAEELMALGYKVDTFDAKHLPEKVNLADYDGVVAGGPIHASVYPRELKKWMKVTASELKDRPLAFFTVCLAVLQEENADIPATLAKASRRFFASTGAEPVLQTTFAGALKYTRYGWFKKGSCDVSQLKRAEIPT